MNDPDINVWRGVYFGGLIVICYAVDLIARSFGFRKKKDKKKGDPHV